MSKRSGAAALTAAIKSNFAGAPTKTDHRAPSRDGLDGWTRSTFKASPETIIAVRSLALRHRCTMNDLILLAIDDLLTAAGKPCAIAVDADLRDRIMNKAANKGAGNEPP